MIATYIPAGILIAILFVRYAMFFTKLDAYVRARASVEQIAHTLQQMHISKLPPPANATESVFELSLDLHIGATPRIRTYKILLVFRSMTDAALLFFLARTLYGDTFWIEPLMGITLAILITLAESIIERTTLFQLPHILKDIQSRMVLLYIPPLPVQNTPPA
jgi:hypothetical protein